MRVNLDIPKPVEETLQRELGAELERITREALAVEAYRTGKLSLGEFAEMLALTIDEADGLLKRRGIYLDITLEELQEDLASLRGLIRQ